VAGGLLEAEWRQVLAFTGFENITWGTETDVFSGSKHESDAAEFETRGVTFSAVLGRSR
jgi:hypothetical protein